MPFDYEKYRDKCNGMTTEQLQKEWENYTRQMSAGATSTATSILFMPVTGGISAVGVGLSAPRIHNARKKREIIEAGLKARGTTHHTRTGDVLAPMAVSGIIGGLTLGLLPPGAESAAGAVAVRGVEIAAANTALNATEAVVIDSARKKAANEAKISDENAQDRYGIMATPFLMDASVLVAPPVFYQGEEKIGLPTDQTDHTTHQPETPTETDQSSTGGDGYDETAPDSMNDRDRSLAESVPTSRDVAGSSSDDHHFFDPHKVGDEVLLALHALSLTMEKHEEEGQTSNPAPYRPQQETMQNTGPIGGPQSSIQSQVQPLGSVQEYQSYQSYSDETAQPWLSNQAVQEQRPALPPRHGHHANSLPVNLSSPPPISSINQDTQNYQYPPQSLPPYQSQYFSSSYQVGEPQQYCPPAPPPQRRQDSGYGSMYPIPSYSSASSQAYASTQTLTSRHYSVPQTYPPPPTSGFYSPHTQAQYGHRASESSIYPMTPPPPYFAPPPGTATAPAAGKENDYFNQNAVPPPHTSQTNSSHSPFNPLLQRGQSIVDEMNKGWQWARANTPIKTPIDSKRIGEPNYGPPPPVPTEWRGS